MYKLVIANPKTEKLLLEYKKQRSDIKAKLERLRQNPREEIGAHPLHGRLRGKWSCWLGSNIRMIYSINDETKVIVIEAVGSHKLY